eukprot:TRINITY_DN3656_c0_g1_i7.p1 TRINITY_DN3656_c0_g1~~TRINITY_DN3656_c0_g1_i7.p1  ORF type:complete len:273 (+),score=72.48 TRINITY_DN3656_c0_g1_i7:548-1366(+)
MDTCKFVHYEIEPLPPPGCTTALPQLPSLATASATAADETVAVLEPQWINCDIRRFHLPLLGKFSVVMADPPWDIHMELNYGTMNDEEIRSLDIQCLQDDGLLFLWVTGRAMELGREAVRVWGYKLLEELIWVKTNQLQRIIRTGRTGHWLNHSKEHCLVAIKGHPKVNTCIDCDVLVSEVRETSRKPDEVYGMLERLSPGTRKLELFGRQHNVNPGWITLGNQLENSRIVDKQLAANIAAWEAAQQPQPQSQLQQKPADGDREGAHHSRAT